MAPRKETLQERTSLVAILLADTFDNSFAPVSIECAPVLLPLIHVPLIEYSLEWLAANEVDESKWSEESEFMKVRAIIGQNCSSIGDALRFVDQMHVIKSDCLVLHGDFVANLQLKDALEAHRNRRKQDSNAILTVVMTSGHEARQRRMLGEFSSHAVVDAATQRLLKYHSSKRAPKPASLEFETSVFSERDTIQVRTDLLDAQLYICAPEVLMSFSENFDYQNLSKDFVGGILSEEELGNKIYFYECVREYAQRVRHWRRYDAVSRDILGRWTFPFSPDTRIFASAIHGATYQSQRGNQYLASNLKLPLTVQLQGRICIGPETTIKDGCTITESAIGKECLIGSKSIISGSYLFDGVTVGKNVQIIGSVLCSGCVVHDNSVVHEGNVLSFGVVIARHHIVQPFQRISLCLPSASKEAAENEEAESPISPPDDVKGPEDVAIKAARGLSYAAPISRIERPAYFDNALVGESGAGVKWPPQHGSLENLLSVAKPLPEYLDELETSSGDESEVGSTSSVAGLDPDQSFEREVAETFLRCVHQQFSEENVILELNGLKLAEVRTFVECASYIFTTLLQMCMPPPPHIRPVYRHLFTEERFNLERAADQKQFFGILKELLAKWSPVLQKFLKDEDDQVELLFSFEEFFKGEGVFNQHLHWGHTMGPLIGNICQLLFNEDVVTEDAFFAWATEKENASDPDDLLFYNKAKKFIEWLKEAEETEESDSEE